MDHLGVAVDESSVKIGEAEKRLDVLDISWFWPFEDCGHLHWVHPEPLQRHDESQAFYSVSVELAFLQVGKQSNFSEAL